MKNNNYFFYLFVLLFCTAFFHTQALAGNNVIDKSTLKGNWIMSEISTDEYVDVTLSKTISTQSGAQPQVLDVQKMPLKKLLEKDLHVGITRFIFHENNTFEFYREQQLTYSGSWSLNENGELILKYASAKGAAVNTKVNKIISLEGKKLVLESESNNKKVVFSFFKNGNQ